MPKQITHNLRLHDSAEATEQFLQEARGLGDRLGCLLVQLPPSLQLETQVAEAFFSHLREHHGGHIACEPRHASWFSPDAVDLLRRHAVARVAADPALHPGAEAPAGDTSLKYFRLHGSPQTYYTRYSDEFLSALADRITSLDKQTREIWCIFDNTAAGHAADNALQLQEMVDEAGGSQ